MKIFPNALYIPSYLQKKHSSWIYFYENYHEAALRPIMDDRDSY